MGGVICEYVYVDRRIDDVSFIPDERVEVLVRVDDIL